MSFGLPKLVAMIALSAALPAVLLATPARAADAVQNQATAKEAPEDPNKPHYIKISPLILPVIGDKGVEQIVSIVIVIEAQSKEAADQIIELSPRLNDAFLTDLYGSIDRREKMGNGLLDIAHVKDRLTTISLKILGADKFKSLLIQGVSQHGVS